MYVCFKITFLIIILYLKLNGSKTSLVTERYKKFDTDNNKLLAIETKNSRTINDNIDSANNVSAKLLTQLLPKKGFASNLVSNNVTLEYDGNFTHKNVSNNKQNYVNEVIFLTQVPVEYTTNEELDPAPPSNNTTPSIKETTTGIPKSYLNKTKNQRKTTANRFNNVTVLLTSKDSKQKPSSYFRTEYTLLNAISSRGIDRFQTSFQSEEKNACLLDNIKTAFMWWALPNGTLRSTNLNSTRAFHFTARDTFLDLSSRNFTKEMDLFAKVLTYTRIKQKKIIAFSAANNQLNQAPYRTLAIMNSTLRYLSLQGNIFYAHNLNENVQFIIDETIKNQIQNIHNNTLYSTFQNTNGNCNSFKQNRNGLFSNEKEGIAWATFPPMPELIELDISNCNIEYVTKLAFKNLTSLRRLFLSHNKMIKIPSDTFFYVQKINYLDLSFINMVDYSIPVPSFEAVFNLIYGVKISQSAFKYLPNLEYLDLSHTKLTRNSAMAFTNLSERLKFLSLCYTAFPMIGNPIFKNTALIALDLSGNPYASYNIIDDTFEGVSDTLKYLFFEKSNIKELKWLQTLSNVRVLGLAGNNINTLSLDTFRSLQQLQVLDLSSNHVGNWYNRVFTHNIRLRVLNLRDNNVNILTTEMLKDFQLLEYLGISDNDFVCDCMLRDLVDIAASNNKDAACVRNVLSEAHEHLMEHINEVSSYVTTNVMNLNLTHQFSVDVLAQTVLNRYLPALRKSNSLMKLYNRAQNRYSLHFVYNNYIKLKKGLASMTLCHKPVADAPNFQKLNGSQLQFQLLDYEDDHYWCFNETEKLQFAQLNCQTRSYVTNIEQQLHTLTKFLLGGLGGLVGFMLLCVLIYIKRWHIHYYYSSLKSAALMSVAAKETVDKFNELSITDPSLVYDIFISYCQNDREWVLEELLPNVEVAGDISICMHERDFQIGLTILDNIISCMDRSKALMLIISSNFLLSHWCQFEMQLAQHRMFEASKEHLILVFLEDIPRSKRPKTLQYLMEMKTYIKWPSAKPGKGAKADDKKLFWKRMKRSLENIGLQHRASHA